MQILKKSKFRRQIQMRKYTQLDFVPRVKKLIISGLFLSGKDFCKVFSHVFPNVQQLTIRILHPEGIENNLKPFIDYFLFMRHFEVVKSRYDLFRDDLCRYPESIPGKLSTYTPSVEEKYAIDLFHEQISNFEVEICHQYQYEEGYEDQEYQAVSETTDEESEDDEESDQFD